MISRKTDESSRLCRWFATLALTVLVGGAGMSALPGAAPERPYSGLTGHHQLAAEPPKSLWNGTGSDCEVCSEK